jgi:hypothetical protein
MTGIYLTSTLWEMLIGRLEGRLLCAWFSSRRWQAFLRCALD